jgi:hypothetical protein
MWEIGPEQQVVVTDFFHDLPSDMFVGNDRNKSVAPKNLARLHGENIAFLGRTILFPLIIHTIQPATIGFQ